jgi:hypothetical protein
MLIDSDFHDYYDVILAHGMDKTCPYLRKTSEIPFSIKHSWSIKDSDTKDLLYSEVGDFIVYRARNNSWAQRKFVHRSLVGFAGAFYPMIEIPHPDRYDEDVIAFSAEEALRVLRDRFTDFMKGIEKDKKGRKKDLRWQNCAHPDKMEDFFNQGKWTPLEHLFREHNVPVLLLTGDSMGQYGGRKRKMVLNPVLKDINFMKVKDPYTAFQEIHGFLSGVLGVGEPMTAEVGNDDRVSQHGFDKRSFRKEPGGKKRKRGK